MWPYVSDRDQKESHATPAYSLLRLSYQTLQHPHASAFALTPFTHTFVALKDQAFPWTVCLSVKRLFGRRGRGGGGGWPQFSQWDLNTELRLWPGQEEHTSAFLYYAFPKALGSIRARRNAAVLGLDRVKLFLPLNMP